MKPGYIFLAVFAVSLLMAGMLPQLGQAIVVPAPAKAQASPNRLPIVTVVPAPESVLQPADNIPEEQEPGIVSIEQTPQANQAPLDETHAEALTGSADAELAAFVESVRNQKQGTVAGIYAPGLFAMPVTGQPSGDESFISEEDYVLTQYATPAQYGVIAVLAHNYLNSGKLLAQLSPTQEVYVVFGEGKVAGYAVSAVQYYHALSPHDTRSDFRDLNGPGGEVLTYDQLFTRVYTQKDKLVFQTCLEANGEISWGRIFILADPIG